MDRIIIKGLKIYAYHGVNDGEKHEGQSFIVDCVMFLDRSSVRFNDNVGSTVSYSKAAKLIQKVMLSKSWDLIETAAENIAKALFNEFEKLIEVEVTLKKPEAPIKNLNFDYMAVQIKRIREDFI